MAQWSLPIIRKYLPLVMMTPYPTFYINCQSNEIVEAACFEGNPSVNGDPIDGSRPDGLGEKFEGFDGDRIVGETIGRIDGDCVDGYPHDADGNPDGLAVKDHGKTVTKEPIDGIDTDRIENDLYYGSCSVDPAKEISYMHFSPPDNQTSILLLTLLCLCENLGRINILETNGMSSPFPCEPFPCENLGRINILDNLGRTNGLSLHWTIPRKPAAETTRLRALLRDRRGMCVHGAPRPHIRTGRQLLCTRGLAAWDDHCISWLIIGGLILANCRGVVHIDVTHAATPPTSSFYGWSEGRVVTMRHQIAANALLPRTEADAGNRIILTRWTCVCDQYLWHYCRRRCRCSRTSSSRTSGWRSRTNGWSRGCRGGCCRGGCCLWRWCRGGCCRWRRNTKRAGYRALMFDGCSPLALAKFGESRARSFTGAQHETRMGRVHALVRPEDGGQDCRAAFCFVIVRLDAHDEIGNQTLVPDQRLDSGLTSIHLAHMLNIELREAHSLAHKAAHKGVFRLDGDELVSGSKGPRVVVHNAEHIVWRAGECVFIYLEMTLHRARLHVFRVKSYIVVTVGTRSLVRHTQRLADLMQRHAHRLAASTQIQVLAPVTGIRDHAQIRVATSVLGTHHDRWNLRARLDPERFVESCVNQLECHARDLLGDMFRCLVESVHCRRAR